MNEEENPDDYIAELHNYIQQLGLTDYQARIVICLFLGGELTAREISKASQIPITKIYQVLSELEAMDFIRHTNGKPMRFVGLKPEHAIPYLIERKQKLVDILKQDAEAYVSQLKKLFPEEDKKSAVEEDLNEL